MTIALSRLEPVWLKRESDRQFQEVRRISQADGVRFLCPKCFEANGFKRPGDHSVICWGPDVPQTTQPTPGRWAMEGTGFADLTLVAGSSSVALTSGCRAHFWIRKGQAVPCSPGWA